MKRNETALPLPDLGVSATVVVDQHNGEPRTVDDQIKADWRDFGVGYVYEDGSAPVEYLTLADEELAKRQQSAENRRQAEALRREADRLERAR